MSESHYAWIASLYDRFVKTDYDVPFFINETKKTDGVLELMAGTGRLTIPLLEAGIQVTAVDFSAEMLAVLRPKLSQKGLNAVITYAPFVDDSSPFMIWVLRRTA